MDGVEAYHRFSELLKKMVRKKIVKDNTKRRVSKLITVLFKHTHTHTNALYSSPHGSILFDCLF